MDHGRRRRGLGLVSSTLACLIAGCHAADAGADEPGQARGVEGTRVFWIQTSILSNSGASGYVHFCPGGLFWESSEASFSVEGGSGWAGGASAGSADGTWHVVSQDGAPAVVMQYPDGSTGGYWVSDLAEGRSWRFGAYRYAAEPGRASCP